MSNLKGNFPGNLTFKGSPLRTHNVVKKSENFGSLQGSLSYL